MLISETYRQLNIALHAEQPKFGTSGKHYAATVKNITQMYNCWTILDYGSGKGTLKALMRQNEELNPITEYDPAVEGRDSAPLPADLVVCTDVLEHIEPECLDAVLDDIRRCTRNVFFAGVSCGAALKSLSDGRNAHLIQETPAWWLPKLMQRFDLDRFIHNKTGFEAIMVAK